MTISIFLRLRIYGWEYGFFSMFFFSYGSSGGSRLGILYGFFGEVGLRYRLL